MVEHMAFKGTSILGSLNPFREHELLDRVEEAADAYFDALQSGAPQEEIDRRHAGVSPGTGKRRREWPSPIYLTS